MTERCYYFQIPIINTEFCFSCSEQNTRLRFAFDGYPDGTKQILMGKMRARVSPGADTNGSTTLIFH